MKSAVSVLSTSRKTAMRIETTETWLAGYHARPSSGITQLQDIAGNRTQCRDLPAKLQYCNRIPTMLADIRFASVPAIIALNPSCAPSCRRVGGSELRPPITIQIEARLANPQSANVAMVNDRASSAACCAL